MSLSLSPLRCQRYVKVGHSVLSSHRWHHCKRSGSRAHGTDGPSRPWVSEWYWILFYFLLNVILFLHFLLFCCSVHCWKVWRFRCSSLGWAVTVVFSFISAHFSVHSSLGLTDNCRDCATHCLQFLKELKLKATLPRADPTAVRCVVQRILNQGQVSSTTDPRWHGVCLCVSSNRDLRSSVSQDLRPRGTDVRKEELADMVDKEMAATSSAIEDAVLRMDVSHCGKLWFFSNGIYIDMHTLGLWKCFKRMLSRVLLGNYTCYWCAVLMQCCTGFEKEFLCDFSKLQLFILYGFLK